jgi:hypothetical protein
MITCRICGKQFLNIPPTAERLNRRLWRLEDGSVHDFYQPNKQQAATAEETK